MAIREERTIVKTRLHIVIVQYYAEKILRKCLNFLFIFTKRSFVLSFHDNSETRYPLTALWNGMASQSDTEFLCFLNPDVLVSPGWDERLMETMDFDANIAVAGPSCNHPPQNFIVPGDPMPEDPDYEDLIRASKAAAMAWPVPPAHPDDPHKSPNSVTDTEIYGHCFFVRRSHFKDLAGFDERFTLFGQDSAFNLAARRSGKRVVLSRRAYVYHYKSASVREGMENGTLDFISEADRSRNLIQAIRIEKHPA